MKMKVKQWEIVISTMKEARDKAERKYKTIAANDSLDDYTKSEAWSKYDDLCGIVNILEATDL